MPAYGGDAISTFEESRRPSARVIGAGALLVAVLAGTLAVDPAPALTPNEVYLRAQAAINALPLPPYIAFTEQNQSLTGHGTDQERLRIVERTSDGVAYVRKEQTAAGNAASGDPTVVTDGDYPTTIYRVGDFPLADFGMRLGHRKGPGMFEAPGTPQPEASGETGGLHVIGSVKALNLPYRVTDLGDTVLDGTPVYHLKLEPVRDPGHHVLREMWVNRTSFLPLRYVAERFVSDVISFRYLVRVDTALIDGHLVNVAADGHFDVHRLAIIHYSGEGRWTISDVRFPSAPPDWAFDPTAVRAHHGETVEAP